MYQLHNVSFTLDSATLLDQVNLTFTPGKVYGLIGHNGSGKSTLIKLLARQLTASQGQILLNNRSLSSYHSREFAREVAYLPQILPQQTFLTVKELVLMGRFAWQGLFKQHSKEDHAIVEQSLKQTHTTMYKDKAVDQLSGGERSRVWLAMLLAQQSKFLLLDEPLAALDIAHQVEVMQLIKHLSISLSLGVIIVIHDINLAARFCDQLIALHSGKVIFNGTAMELMQPEVLHAIYNVDLQVTEHPSVADVKVAFY